MPFSSNVYFVELGKFVSLHETDDKFYSRTIIYI